MAYPRNIIPGICACSAPGNTLGPPPADSAEKCGLPAGAIVVVGSGWAADAGPWDRFPCDPAQPMAQHNITTLPFCNASLPRPERVKDLVARIPDSDRFSLLPLLQTGGVHGNFDIILDQFSRISQLRPTPTRGGPCST